LDVGLQPIVYDPRFREQASIPRAYDRSADNGSMLVARRAAT
jgi:hypothetical protein